MQIQNEITLKMPDVVHKNLIGFLQRANLKGDEVPAFNEVFMHLKPIENESTSEDKNK